MRSCKERFAEETSCVDRTVRNCWALNVITPPRPKPRILTAIKHSISEVPPSALNATIDLRPFGVPTPALFRRDWICTSLSKATLGPRILKLLQKWFSILSITKARFFHVHHRILEAQTQKSAQPDFLLHRGYPRNALKDTERSTFKTNATRRAGEGLDSRTLEDSREPCAAK